MKPKFEIGQEVYCYTAYNREISPRKKTIERIILSKDKVKYEMKSECELYSEEVCFDNKNDFDNRVLTHLKDILNNL